MSTSMFAEHLMKLDASEGTPPADGLSEEEHKLLTEARREDPNVPGFEFASSAHFAAVDYVRRNQSELAEQAQRDFGWYVANKFSRTYGSAIVESGCVKMS
jgi:hypothetical protein